ncbi:MAG: phytoene/squalene synthase family protein, partial [bacterium]|nr:phytoene/squalene synthase family protein [bacterium]
MSDAALVLRRDDRLACREWIKRHSKSFFLSSLLLPVRVRQASWALYAFCRRADDAVDVEAAGGMARVDSLRRRLDHVYAGRADDDAIDRA